MEHPHCQQAGISPLKKGEDFEYRKTKTLDKQKTTYINNTYTNNTHKKMYQNSYTNIPEQYINIIRNGPTKDTIILGQQITDSFARIWIKPRIIIGIYMGERKEIYLVDDGELKILNTKITEDFGGNWLRAFSGTYNTRNTK